MSRYYFGEAVNMGVVKASQIATFPALIEHLRTPVVLSITKDQYHALDAKQQNEAKRTRYIVPCEFTAPLTKRVTENVVRANLLALDIDDNAEAKRLLGQDWNEAFGEFGFIVWHTATSTADKPRLRILVNADAIHPTRYKAAVRTIGEKLGLTAINTESLVIVQPMYLPVQFKDETGSKIVAARDGEAFSVSDIVDHGESSLPVDAPSIADVGDLEFLRAPMDNLSLDDVRDALSHLDPDCPMQQWVEVAAGLKHQFQDNEQAAYALWDQWSSKGKKYVDSAETEYRWGTIKANPPDRAPVTIRSVLRWAQARGWANTAVTQRLYKETLSWITAQSRSSEELLDQGVQRIAKVSPAIGQLEKKSLLNALKSSFERYNMPMTLPDLKAAVKKLEIEAAKEGGVPAWAKGICFITATNTFYRYTVNREFKPEVLDLMYSAPSIGEDKTLRPRDYMIQVAGIPQVENRLYVPSAGAKRFVTVNDVPFVNIYTPSYPTPDPEHAAAAGELFMKHLHNLIAEPDYVRRLADWLIYHVQNPGKKIRYAVLLQGAQGSGKTFLGVCMAAVLGRGNLKKLNAKDVVESTHNDWAYGHQMVVIEEMRVMGANRHAVMDALKPCISDDEINLHEKFKPHRTVENITNYFMLTNHHDSLAINDTDRRYFVIASAIQHPSQIEAMGGAAYFDTLFALPRDNAAGLRAWMESYKISEDFNPEGRAPVTKYLKELADAAASPLTSCILQQIADEPHPLVKRDLVSLSALRQCLDTEHLPTFTDQAVSAILRENGWERAGRYMVAGERHSLWKKGEIADPRRLAEARVEFL